MQSGMTIESILPSERFGADRTRKRLLSSIYRTLVEQRADASMWSDVIAHDAGWRESVRLNVTKSTNLTCRCSFFVKWRVQTAH
jgi:hypothetical protein